MNDTEKRSGGSAAPTLSIDGSRDVLVQLPPHMGIEPQRFKFDHVLNHAAGQSDVFDLVGYPLVDNCLAGFNSTVFAYGQTGAGKTHTIMGDLAEKDGRGLAPRAFEYLFEKIAAEADESVTYQCRGRCELGRLMHSWTVTSGW